MSPPPLQRPSRGDRRGCCTSYHDRRRRRRRHHSYRSHHRHCSTYRCYHSCFCSRGSNSGASRSAGGGGRSCDRDRDGGSSRSDRARDGRCGYDNTAATATSARRAVLTVTAVAVTAVATAVSSCPAARALLDKMPSVPPSQLPSAAALLHKPQSLSRPAHFPGYTYMLRDDGATPGEETCMSGRPLSMLHGCLVCNILKCLCV